MKTKVFRAIQIAVALTLIFGGIMLPGTAPAASADDLDITLTLSGPSYVTPGNNITYELTLKNFQSQPITAITVWNPLLANTTYVSGGTLFAGDNGVAFNLASLAANATHKFTLVVNVGSGVDIGKVIANKDAEIESYIIGADNLSRTAENSIGTTVEAPGTVEAVYKNGNGRDFDVTVDGFRFENFTNDAPRVSSDDLSKEDIFTLLGPNICQSGTTAATCVLSGPAQQYMASQINGMSSGHCDGMATISLRLFDQLPFKGKKTPGEFQSGASNTIDLDFPNQSIENYVAYYFITQTYDEVYYDAQYTAGPKEIVNRLKAEFTKAEPEAYVLWIEQMPGHKSGHAVTAYGVEKVNAGESRILIYDNNYPKQRKYLTVNMAKNTWRYVTAATPGETPDIYTGTAASKNLSIVKNSARDMPAGEYFTCDFCPDPEDGASAQAAATGQVDGMLEVQYVGEGAILVVNDEGQKTGDDPESKTFVDEIPNTQIRYHRGGLGKEVPPRISFPFSETDDTFYTVIVHGETVSNTTAGSLNLTGAGFMIGVNDVELDPQEQFEFTVSPDGDHISFDASEDITAPEIYIAHDPVYPGDPSVIFDIEGVTLLAGEKVSLDLDPELERIHFAHSGPEAENFVIDMKLIWPDGDVENYAETVNVPTGATSAFIDFGAWDGLLHPPTYIDDVLQNPSVNHRLKLKSSTGTYDATPQANAPAGVYHVEATFTNVTEVMLQDVYFTVADLAAGNLLLNADGSPAGKDAKVSVPAAALGVDELLHVNESFTFTFDVGLANAGTSNFTVDANGVPHDWMHEAPPLAGEANNASFVFAIEANAGSTIFLPILMK